MRRRKGTKPFQSGTTEPEIQRTLQNLEDEKTRKRKRIFNSDESKTLESICVVNYNIVWMLPIIILPRVIVSAVGSFKYGEKYKTKQCQNIKGVSQVLFCLWCI